MTRTTISKGSIGILGTLGIGAVAALGVPTAAAQTGGQPDLGHYCRAHHGAQATVEYNAERGAWVCAEQRGYVRRLYRVDFGEACKLTFGARGFRSEGANAHCYGAVSRVAPDTTPPRRHLGGRGAYRQVIPNLSAYCRKTYGRRARVAFDRASGLYACVQGRSRAYRRIDMAAACYQTVHTTNYRFDGDRREIRCLVSI